MATEEKIIASIDINGFRKYSTRITPEELFKTMNNYYKVADNVISSCDGEIIKGIGDCILATFNKSKPLRFIQKANIIKTSLESWWGEKIEDMGVNIHAHIGTVSYGIIKIRNKEWYDIFGEAVNELFQLRGNGIILSDKLQKHESA